MLAHNAEAHCLLAQPASDRNDSLRVRLSAGHLASIQCNDCSTRAPGDTRPHALPSSLPADPTTQPQYHGSCDRHSRRIPSTASPAQQAEDAPLPEHKQFCTRRSGMHNGLPRETHKNFTHTRVCPAAGEGEATLETSCWDSYSTPRESVLHAWDADPQRRGPT